MYDDGARAKSTIASTTASSSNSSNHIVFHVRVWNLCEKWITVTGIWSIDVQTHLFIYAKFLN
jgi:hypothetical protein